MLLHQKVANFNAYLTYIRGKTSCFLCNKLSKSNNQKMIIGVVPLQLSKLG